MFFLSFLSERLLLPNENENKKVGFYAYIRTPDTIGQHKVMVFNVVETHVGSAYDNHMWTFNAPVSGLYAFACSLYPGHESYGNLYMFVNDRVVSRISTNSYTDDLDLSPSSTTVLLSLKQGNDVYIRSREISGLKNVGIIEGGTRVTSSLTGWLMSE